MQVPLLDLKPQLNKINDEIEDAINEVVKSTQYVKGPKVEKLEKEIAEYCNVKNAIGVSSGTDALLVSLMALDIGPDDIVITPDYSFIATTEVISRLKAKPVFIDIDRSTYNLDPKELRKWFENNEEKINRVKAIIPVHLFGQCADMNPIIEIADEYNVPIVEDAAQAIGAKYPLGNDYSKAGSMGKTGCFSFFPSKNLGGMGDGGMVVTDDDRLAEKIKKLRNHGSQAKYDHSLIGGNFRLDPIQAAVLSVKLKYLDKWHKNRQENAKRYDEGLYTEKIKTPEIAYMRNFHIYNQYVISVSNRRDELADYLDKKEIGYSIYYPIPFHQQECYDHLDYESGDFPNSEYAAESTIALPIYPELSEKQQDYVIKSINEFFK